MSESPSWLSTSAPAPSASTPAPRVDPLSIEPSTADGAGDGAADGAADDEKDLPSIILMMRLLNMGAATALVACSVRGKNCLVVRNND